VIPCPFFVLIVIENQAAPFAIRLVFFQTRATVQLNMSEQENGQLPLMMRTVRSRVSSERWEQIKTAYASGIALREIARNMSIPAGTVLARAKREAWPGDALSCFAFSDDYSFGILQSGIHWSWFIATCSKLKGDFRYTPESVFDTFPWPQKPKHEDIKAVSGGSGDAAGVATGDDEEVELLAAAASYFSSRVFCLV
jgi:hypothetical protein